MRSFGARVSPLKKNSDDAEAYEVSAALHSEVAAIAVMASLRDLFDIDTSMDERRLTARSTQ